MWAERFNVIGQDRHRGKGKKVEFTDKEVECLRTINHLRNKGCGYDEIRTHFGLCNLVKSQRAISEKHDAAQFLSELNKAITDKLEDPLWEP